MIIIKRRETSIPLFMGIAFFLLINTPSGRARRSGPRYYLVRKTCIVQNATVSSGKTEIFLLDSIKDFGNLAFKPVTLEGKAFLTLPSERREATQEAVYQALASYSPDSREAWVASTAVTGTNRPGASTRVVTLFLFTFPTIPISVVVKGNTLSVSFNAAVSKVDTRSFPPLTRESNHILFPEINQVCQDFARRILTLFPFPLRND